MKTIILTSNPVFFKENVKKAIKLTNINLIDTLKKEIEKYENVLFICSSPDEYKINEEYANLVYKSLFLSGIKFKIMDLIDSRNWLFSRALINNADLIILMGGDPLEQMEFFNNIELKDKLKKYSKCIMGVSGGSINMASDVYCSQDDKIESSCYYKGLGLTNIRVEPHFNINNDKRINDLLLQDSKKKNFVALEDDSFILIKKNNIELFGKGYYFNDGSYKQIDNKEIKRIYGKERNSD